MSKRILIVDDELPILRMVEALMDRFGYVVETARDGEEGLQKALRNRPDLIITDVLMPKVDGWTFVRNLRARTELHLIPVIFLTALNNAKDRILGFRLGADDYLPKPFHLDELSTRVQRILRRSEQFKSQVHGMTSGEQSAVGLRGNLAQLGVSSVLTILELERKSGILVLVDRGRTGRVFIKKGRVLNAFFDGEPSPRGAQAIFQMLTWKSGRFSFSDLEVEMEDNIGQSTTQLLMEGARLIDEDAERDGDR